MPNQIEQQNAERSAETEVHRGYGACSTSGCNCQGYTGSGNTCENCGHNYSAHW